MDLRVNTDRNPNITCINKIMRRRCARLVELFTELEISEEKFGTRRKVRLGEVRFGHEDCKDDD